MYFFFYIMTIQWHTLRNTLCNNKKKIEGKEAKKRTKISLVSLLCESKGQINII